MSHSELIAELPKLEKLSNVARLKHAKKRRQKQMKNYYELQRTQRASRTYEAARQQASPPDKEEEQGLVLHFVDTAVLCDLVIKNDIVEVKKLLAGGVDPNVSNADGLTPLHRCCIENTVELAEILVEHGADLNARDIEGWTPLHAASACGNLPILNLLLDEGASLVAINHDDKMPVDVAADADIRHILQQRMLEAGYTDDVLDYIRVSVPKTMLADIKDSIKTSRSLNMQDKYGASALHTAAANGYMEVLELLLAQPDINVNIQDNEGWTPFHAAVCWSQKDAMKMLAEKGADMDTRNIHDETAFAIAEDPDIRQYILELKGKFSTEQSMEMETSEMESHQPRQRRLSVKRMSAQAREEMGKEAIKSEAMMRNESMAQQDIERRMSQSQEAAAIADLGIEVDEEDPTTPTLLKVNSTKEVVVVGSGESSVEQNSATSSVYSRGNNPFAKRPRKSVLKDRSIHGNYPTPPASPPSPEDTPPPSLSRPKPRGAPCCCVM